MEKLSSWDMSQNQIPFHYIFLYIFYPASEASYGIGSREGEISSVGHATPPWGWHLGKQKLVEWTQGIALYVWSKLEVG